MALTQRGINIPVTGQFQEGDDIVDALIAQGMSVDSAIGSAIGVAVIEANTYTDEQVQQLTGLDPATITALQEYDEAVDATDATFAGVVGTSGTATRDALDGRYAKRDAIVWDIRDHGVPTDGTTLANTALAALVAQMAPGDTLFVPADASVRLGSSLSLSKPVVIDWAGTLVTTGNIDCLTFSSGASGSRVRRLTGQGPGGSGVSRLLSLAGTPGGSWVEDIVIEDVTADDFYGTLRASHARDLVTRNVRTKDGHYHGQMFLSCENVAVHNPVTHNLTGLTSNSNSYGVAFTRDTNQSAATHPDSAHCRVYGGETRNTTWEAIDTHGGHDIKVYDHTAIKTRFGIAFVEGADGTPPTDCWAYGCHVDSDVSDGSASNGLSLIGVGLADDELATGGFIGCTVIGHGLQSSLASGGVRMRYTRGAVLSGLDIVEPSPVGLSVDIGNLGLLVQGVTATDPWSTDAGYTAFGRIVTGNNTVTISGTQLLRGSKSAARVAEHGWRTSNSLLDLSVVNAGGNDYSAASGVVWQNMLQYMKQGFYATEPVAKPTGVAVTPEAIHAALVSLGLISA